MPTKGAEPRSTQPWLLQSIELENFLSFGPDGEQVNLRGLNVFIGANGSGKSNIIEAIAILSASTQDLSLPFRGGGGVRNWLFSGLSANPAVITATVRHRSPKDLLVHKLVFTEEQQRLEVLDETISRTPSPPSLADAVYSFRGGRPIIRRHGNEYALTLAQENQSVLSQIKDPITYPDVASLQHRYARIRLYRSWVFGPRSVLREPQDADSQNETLVENFSNLFLMLNKMELHAGWKAALLERIRDVLPEVSDYTLQIQGGTVQLFLLEGSHSIPATRLSDGTLRWLCLLAILVAPVPGLVVLEEPELGLHPDMINSLAELLKQASNQTQLIVTTHSDILIDALTDAPESVLTVDKVEGQTKIRRLSETELQPWLANYRLGRLWMKGVLGATRW